MDARIIQTLRVDGAALKTSRQLLNLTQAEMAELLGLPRVAGSTTVSRWETGYQQISGDYLLRWMLLTKILPGQLAYKNDAPYKMVRRRAAARKRAKDAS